MKRRYNMPFGAECRDDGSVRFRLWAPAARQVEIALAGANRAKALIKENKPFAYWYSPEYHRPSDLLKLASVPIQDLYQLFSGPAHGSFSGQVLLNDDSTVQDINPRPHPLWTPRAIEASSRLLLEIGHSRDVSDNLGHLADYEKLLQRVVDLK
jgi:hypothetical protein